MCTRRIFSFPPPSETDHSAWPRWSSLKAPTVQHQLARRRRSIYLRSVSNEDFSRGMGKKNKEGKQLARIIASIADSLTVYARPRARRYRPRGMKGNWAKEGKLLERGLVLPGANGVEGNIWQTVLASHIRGKSPFHVPSMGTIKGEVFSRVSLTYGIYRGLWAWERSNFRVRLFVRNENIDRAL